MTIDNTVYVTTSWDDGHRLDLRLAAELAEFEIRGTFYVAPRCREIAESERLNHRGLRELGEHFEIGAHTLTHPRLPSLSAEEARREIVDGRGALEDVLGETVDSFCYPYGAYTHDHRDLVRSLGFVCARTVDRFRTARPDDPFQMGTTTHACRHLVDGSQILRRSLKPHHVRRMWQNWDVLGLNIVEEVRSSGGVIHLWGHSWEIDKNDDWGRLRRMLRKLSELDAIFVTNGQLASTGQV